MSAQPVKQRRAYDNTGRAEQARATRRRIIAAARAVLVASGYSATTMTAVAAEAGVSVETIYKAFRTKSALVKSVYDTALAGDDEAVPLLERPEARGMLEEPTAAGKLAHYAGFCRRLYDRLGPLLGVLLVAARSGEPDLRSFGRQTDRERLRGAARIVELIAGTGELRPELDHRRACDIVWTLNSPEVHRLLTVDRRWSGDAYEQFLTQTLVGALLQPPSAPEPPQPRRVTGATEATKRRPRPQSTHPADR